MAEREDTGFKVTDRRKYNPDGSPRESAIRNRAGSGEVSRKLEFVNRQRTMSFRSPLSGEETTEPLPQAGGRRE